MKNPLDALNKMPPKTRFAVIAAGAGGLGYIAYRRRQTEMVPVEEVEATGADVLPAEAGAGGGYNGYTPIVVTGGGGNSNAVTDSLATVLPEMADLYMQGAGSVMDMFRSGFDSVLGSYDQQASRNSDLIANMMTSGGPVQSPTIQIVNPAVQPAAPTVVPAPAAATQIQEPACPAGFPHRNKATGLCYRNSGADKAGKDSNGNSYKKGDSLNIYSNGRVVKD